MRGGAKLAVPAMLYLYETTDPSGGLSLLQQLRATLASYLPLLPPKVRVPTVVSRCVIVI